MQLKCNLAMAKIVATIFSSLLSQQPLSAKDLGLYPVADQSFDLKLETVSPQTGRGTDGDKGIPINKMVSLVVTVKAKPGSTSLLATALEFDAFMPAHRHGMIVKPVVTSIGPNTFRIDGVKLHMAGEWQFVFRLQVGGQWLAKETKINYALPAR